MKVTKKKEDTTTTAVDKDTGLPTQFLVKKLLEAEKSPTVDQSIDEILADVKAEGRRTSIIHPASSNHPFQIKLLSQLFTVPVDL